MSEFFVMYLSRDLMLAQVVRSVLEARGTSVSLRCVPPRGEQATEDISKLLSSALCVILLASKAACRSPYVRDELGSMGSLLEKLVVFTWDVEFADLPGWMASAQVLDARSSTLSVLNARIDKISASLRRDKVTDVLFLLAGAISAFAFIAPNSSSLDGS